MGNLRLVFPTISFKDEWLSYIKEYKADNHDCNIHMGFTENMSYEEWLQCKVYNQNSVYFPSTIFFLVNDKNRIYGVTEITQRLNEFYSSYGGNISYAIRPSERNKGYGTYMLKLVLDECKKLGMNKVLVTCLKHNIGSSKIILDNGGVLDDEVYFEPEHDYMMRYFINI